MDGLKLCIIALLGLSAPAMAGPGQNDPAKPAEKVETATAATADATDAPDDAGKRALPIREGGHTVQPNRVSKDGSGDLDSDGMPDVASQRGGGRDPLKGTNAQRCVDKPETCAKKK